MYKFLGVLGAFAKGCCGLKVNNAPCLSFPHVFGGDLLLKTLDSRLKHSGMTVLCALEGNE